MEAIRMYLENMFLHLPVTPEVIKAKSELAQMMEDKYNELKSEGKSENEAVGIVISEFGNLSELAEALGIGETVRAQESELHADTAESIPLTADVAREYLNAKAKSASRIGVGVMLCIFSLIGPCLAASAENSPAFAPLMTVGVASMFILIGTGVGLFIYSATCDGVWRELENNASKPDFSTAQYIKQEQAAYHPTYTMFLTIGVILSILSIVPVSVLGILQDYSTYTHESGFDYVVIGAALFFAIVGIGVMMIVMSSIRNSSYRKLLRTCAPLREEDEDLQDLTPAGRRVMSVFWPTVTSLYLILSFLTFAWHRTWIIWPIAAALASLLKAVFRKEESQ